MPKVEELLCTVLRGEKAPWPEHGDADFAARFLERSAHHGVQALLHHHFQNWQGAAPGWPEIVLDACRTQARAQTMWEMRHKDLLDRVLARLTDAGVEPILFKGTALAYSLYPAPFLRARGDTDLIVPSSLRDRTAEVLESLGFARARGAVGEIVTYQANYCRTEPAGDMHAFDLHWRITNSQLLSNLFSYEELRHDAVLLPALGAHAIAASPVCALALACMHRAIHKQIPYYVDGVVDRSVDRLIWLYDIHLLFGTLSPAQQHEFVELADVKGLRATCLEAIEQARACFHGPVPEAVLAALAGPGRPEPAADYLGGSAWYQFYADFWALEDVRSKLGFLAELLLPPASDMRLKYPQARRTWLPWLYLRRASGGLLKRFR